MVNGRGGKLRDAFQTVRESGFKMFKIQKSYVQWTIQNYLEWKPFRKPSIGDGSQIIPGRDFHGTVVSENGLKFLEGEQVIGVRKSLLKRNFVHSRIVKKIKTSYLIYFFRIFIQAGYKSSFLSFLILQATTVSSLFAFLTAKDFRTPSGFVLKIMLKIENKFQLLQLYWH